MQNHHIFLHECFITDTYHERLMDLQRTGGLKKELDYYQRYLETTNNG